MRAKDLLRTQGDMVCTKTDEPHTLQYYILPLKEKGGHMANYAIMRIEKRKMAAVGRIGKHNERLKTEYKSNPDIDPERTQFNYHLKEPAGSYRKMVLDRIQEAGARMRKDSVVLQDCFIGATPEWIRSKPPEIQREYFETALGFFEKTFGKENIVSAVVHMDEATPHMHLCFVPITKDNRLSSKELIGGPQGMSKLQDQFYEHMSGRYPELTRGTPKRVTQRQHVPPYMFKNATVLYEHYNEIVKAVNDIGIFNSGKKKEDAIALLGRYAPEMVNLKDQLKATDSKIAFLERTVDQSRDEIRSLRGRVTEKEDELYKANRSLFDLNQKQKKLDALISKIPPEVLEQIAQAEKKARKERNRGLER
jgi:hypothetical protein